MSKAVIAAKISNLLEYGRKQITTKKELEQYPIGSLISYMNKNDEFKQGGFIIKYAEEYFIYITPDFKTKYRVRYQNIKKMWVGNVYKIIGNDIISLSKTSQKKTDHPVKIGNIIVYYASKKFDKTRFMNTKKYNIMVNWYEYFGKTISSD
ncbi:hypothetical protein [Acanthamoeba polyphaga mimivirus]|uniref:Uncharacterized protein n=1 Tax=Acanthamoeba polyphaga mimivirus TaxID=212035 RepID=A0A2L2DKZ0_MIMIV|nr:hypothetical protein [Acanthamoeba polyphaga mimivirus]